MYVVHSIVSRTGVQLRVYAVSLWPSNDLISCLDRGGVTFSRMRPFYVGGFEEWFRSRALSPVPFVVQSHILPMIRGVLMDISAS